MSLHIPGLQTESWFGANWVEGRKDGRPFFMNVITGETTHVRPKIQQQEQIAALTADQVLGDLPIQTPGKRAKGLPQAHPQRRTGLHASSVEGGGGSGGGVSYAGAGAGSLYIPQPTQSQGIFGTGLGANPGGSQLRSNNRDHIGGGTLSDEDGPEDIDMEATLGAFDHLDLMDGVEFNTGPPLGFPPSGSLSPLSGREIPKNMRHSRVSRPASRELAGTVHAAARRTNSTHSSSSRDGIGSHSRSATKGGNDSSSATGLKHALLYSIGLLQAR